MVTVFLEIIGVLNIAYWEGRDEFIIPAWLIDEK